MCLNMCEKVKSSPFSQSCIREIIIICVYIYNWDVGNWTSVTVGGSVVREAQDHGIRE